MRHLRILTGLIAAFAMVLFGLTAAPSQAATTVETTSAPVERTTTTTTERRAKPRHDFAALKAEKIRGTKNRFYVAGKVTSYKNKRLKLLRSNKKRGNYRPFKTQRTNGKGYFRINFSAPVGTHLRLLVPQTKFRKTTKVYIGRIIRKY